MRASDRIERVHRLRTALRELADRAAARAAADVAAVDRDLAATRAAEDGSRVVVGTTSGSAVASAWAWADALRRRAMGLLDDRARTVTSAEGAYETVRDRRREEEQLARIAARARVGERDDATREDARALDALALWAHGRKR
jgi:hypothetical protein